MRRGAGEGAAVWLRLFAATAVLLALPLLHPRLARVHPRLARAQEVNWQGPLSPDVAWVLGSYYGPAAQRSNTRSACRADDGEICYNGDHEDHNWRSPWRRRPEDVAQFLADLAEAARAHPDDALAFAQVVYAYTRLRDYGDALAVADECAFETWWCELLLGMVHDRGGRTHDAEARFRAALARADPALASHLTGIADLLGRDNRSEYRRLAGDARANFEARFWWLTDPMWSIPGNDRWTAHVRRRFEALLHAHLLGARGGSHRHPHEGELVRRGPEDSWSASSTPAARWTSMRAARYRFTPISAISAGIGAVRYDLRAERTDERYTPRTYGPVVQVPAQFARFREGDSLLVVAAARVNDAPHDAPRTAFLVSDGPGRLQATTRRTPADNRPVFEAVVARWPVVVSIESLDGQRGAARARAGLPPLDSGELDLSDPLLVTTAALDPPLHREDAVARMLATTTVAAGSVLTVYWEIYGVSREQPLWMSLSIEGARPGWFTRGLRALRIRSAPRLPTVSWTRTASAGTNPTALEVDLGNIGVGEYTLRIEAIGPDGARATAERRLTVQAR